MPISEAVKEKMIADVMELLRNDAAGTAAQLVGGMPSLKVILALPIIIAALVEAVVGLNGVELTAKMEREAWLVYPEDHETHPGKYVHMTIPHALYRLLEDSLPIAESAAFNAAKAELFTDP